MRSQSFASWLKDVEKVNRDLVVLVSTFVLRRDSNILRHALVRSRPAPGTDVNLSFLDGADFARSSGFFATNLHFRQPSENAPPMGSHFTGSSWVNPATSTNLSIDPNRNPRMAFFTHSNSSASKGVLGFLPSGYEISGLISSGM